MQQGEAMNSRLIRVNQLLIRAVVLALLLLAATLGNNSVAAQATATPIGLLAYVTNDSNDTVSVINTVTNELVATIPVGRRPIGVAVSPNGSLVYVTNLWSNSVSVIATGIVATSTTSTPTTRVFGIAGIFTGSSASFLPDPVAGKLAPSRADPILPSSRSGGKNSQRGLTPGKYHV